MVIRYFEWRPFAHVAIDHQPLSARTVESL